MKTIDMSSYPAGEDQRVARRTRKRGRVFTLGLTLGLAGLMSTAVFVQPPEPAPRTAAASEDLVRDTEAEALVAARALNQPVEVLAHRTEYRDVFAQPDGTLIANGHTQPVRVTQGDAWVPADSTLVVQPDGSYAPAAALLGMQLSQGGTAPLMVVTRDQKSMTLTWPHGPLPAPVIEESKATYPNVFQDVDLVTNVTVEGFSHVLVVKTPEAADLPELQNLRLGVAAVGLTIEETAEGGVVALDRSPTTRSWRRTRRPCGTAEARRGAMRPRRGRWTPRPPTRARPRPRDRATRRRWLRSASTTRTTPSPSPRTGPC